MNTSGSELGAKPRASIGLPRRGSATATAWITRKTLSKRELLREEMRKREALYVYALINRIRLSSSQAVLVEAEHLLRRITWRF
jgi:hypothetical protein